QIAVIEEPYGDYVRPRDLTKKITGSERDTRPQYDASGKELVGHQNIPQFKFLKKNVILKGQDPSRPLIDQIRNAATDPRIRKELMATAGHPLELDGAEPEFNKALMQVRQELFGGSRNEYRAATQDKTAGARRNQA